MGFNSIRKQYIFAGVLFLCFCCFFRMMTVGAAAAGRIQDTGDELIVVIDPGHGGENQGTTENGFLEKSMTMSTALAMYDELSKFEGIRVYLTHTDDVDMSLKERAQFAAKKDADLLISIHYNASETHLLYGSEVWISLQPVHHAIGYQFATVAMREFRDMGMNLRGIKTKPSSKGDDYYGIIRESASLGLTAVILEHCHVDHPRDVPNCDTEEKQKAYGISDAHAVAKYYGLKSAALGVDYSDYEETLPEVSLNGFIERTVYDAAAPDQCEITAGTADYMGGQAEILVTAKDSETNLIYYSYSLDGGKNYSEILPWPVGDILTGNFPDTVSISLSIPEKCIPNVCIRVYNPYDLYTESNVVSFEREFGVPDQEETEASEEISEFEDATALLVPDKDNEKKGLDAGTMLRIVKIVLPIVLVVFLVLLGLYFLSIRKKGTESN